MEIAARIEEMASGIVESLGAELVHVEVLPKSSPTIVRLMIDKPGGVTLDDCQKISRQVGVVLEIEDCIDGRYLLEVTSPGIERPLFKEDDYRRFTGKEIRLMTFEKIEGRKNFTGRIEGLSEGVLSLGCEAQTYRIPFEKIKKAHLVYKF